MTNTGDATHVFRTPGAGEETLEEGVAYILPGKGARSLWVLGELLTHKIPSRRCCCVSRSLTSPTSRSRPTSGVDGWGKADTAGPDDAGGSSSTQAAPRALLRKGPRRRRGT